MMIWVSLKSHVKKQDSVVEGQVFCLQFFLTYEIASTKIYEIPWKGHKM